MLVVAWGMADLEDQLNRIGKGLQTLVDGLLPDSGTNGFNPAADVWTADDHLHIALDVPGMAKEDLKVDLADRVLTIRGRRDTPDAGTFRRRERHSGAFQRAFAVPEGVGRTDIKARFSLGVLTVSVKLPAASASDTDIHIEED